MFPIKKPYEPTKAEKNNPNLRYSNWLVPKLPPSTLLAGRSSLVHRVMALCLDRQKILICRSLKSYDVLLPCSSINRQTSEELFSNHRREQFN